MTNDLMQQYNDQELVSGVLRGSPSHQTALYRQFSVPMFRVVLRFARDKAEAEDMLQEGFVRVYRDMAQFRAEGALGGWIRRIMVNECLMMLRKNQPLTFPGDESEIPDRVDSFNIEADISAREILELLDQLPPGYRTVFNLYVIEGLKHIEIAETLGISINTSKSQLILAKEKLRTLLKRMNYKR